MFHLPIAALAFLAKKAHDAHKKANSCRQCSRPHDFVLSQCCGVKLCRACIHNASTPIMGGLKVTCPACGQAFNTTV